MQERCTALVLTILDLLDNMVKLQTGTTLTRFPSEHWYTSWHFPLADSSRQPGWKELTDVRTL
jgi:hypothetical protein